MFGMFFLGALYLQRVLGYDALDVGLAFLPVSLAIGTLSLGFSERLNMRFGPKATLLPSLVLIAAGLALFARAPVEASYLSHLLPAMLLLGLGAGLSFPSRASRSYPRLPQGDLAAGGRRDGASPPRGPFARRDQHRGAEPLHPVGDLTHVGDLGRRHGFLFGLTPIPKVIGAPL